MRKPTCLFMIVAAVLLSIGPLTPLAHGATDTIMVGNFFFGPNIDTVFKGDTVVWVFTGTTHTTSHNVPPVDRIWDSGFIGPGGSFTFVFDTAGTFAYRCDVHPTTMQATMVVLSGSTGIGNAEDIRMRIDGLEQANREGYKVEVHEIEAGVVYRDENVTVEAFNVPHGSWDHAFGYKFTTPDRTIVLSGDTAPFDGLAEIAKGADVLIHEAYAGFGLEQREAGAQQYHSSFHTAASEVGTAQHGA